MQYTHARACSILKRAGEPDFSDIHFEALSDEASLDVCKLLEAFPDKIKDAAAKLEPLLLPDIWLRLHRRSINLSR